MDQLSSEPNYDVPDSTDWLNTPLSGLMPVEQAFRCHVCKDFYNSPMLTSCNHTFCSLCIRRCLSVEGKCPLCRKTDQESRLRGNWALREAVDCFKECRAAILEFARRPAPTTTIAYPKRKAGEVEEIEDGEEPTPKRPRRSTRSTRTRDTGATPAVSQEESHGFEQTDETDEYRPEIDDGLVACPICWERMKLEAVDRHISTGSCPGAPQPQSQLQAPILNGASTRSAQPSFPSPSKANSKKPTKPLEPLPALNYSMLKDQALRKKLAELQISTWGSRQLLEQRHKEWVTIWNANCDSAYPKTRTELLRDLDTWERTMSSAARTPALYGAPSAPPQVKDKNFDGASWATSHDSSFRDLIAKARRTKKQAELKAEDASTPDPLRVAQQPDGRDAVPRELESVGKDGGNRQHGEIHAVDGAADFTVPVVNDGADRDAPQSSTASVQYSVSAAFK